MEGYNAENITMITMINKWGQTKEKFTSEIQIKPQERWSLSWLPCDVIVTIWWRIQNNWEISDFSAFKTTGNSRKNRLRLRKDSFELSSNLEFQLRNSGLFLELSLSDLKIPDVMIWPCIFPNSQLSWKHHKSVKWTIPSPHFVITSLVWQAFTWHAEGIV